MRPFTTLDAIAAPMPETDVDTDVIFPARFLLLLDKAGLGRNVFHERRYRDGRQTDFVLNRPPYDRAEILVTGANFGSGSSREQAVWALADFGIRCIVAPSFGEIFFGNCLKNGVLAIVLDGDSHARVMRAAEAATRVGVDLNRQLVILPSQDDIAFDIDPYRKRALLLGLDEIGGILADDLAEVETFEKRQRRLYPWLQLDESQFDSALGSIRNPV
jgi:3-isopropylmalate/(R)-2-methylmalate dehydratase small subunit